MPPSTAPSILLFTIAASSPLIAQAVTDVSLPAGTPLWIESRQATPLRVGEAVHAQLRYPVYVHDQLLLPAGSAVEGRIVRLEPDSAHRLQSRLRADFTPFSKPVVQFTTVQIGAASAQPIDVTDAREGSPLLSLSPPPPRKGGVVRKQIDSGIQAAKDQLQVFTGPDKKDRLVQFLYTQLPYHPQRVPKQTDWTVTTKEPVMLTGAAGQATPPVQAEAATQDQELQVQAYLDQEISSKQANGQAITATVVSPALASDGSLGLPQGTQLQGVITRAKPARRFARPGTVRFAFTQVKLPDADAALNVQTTMNGIDAPAGEDLQLDREGNAQQKPKDKVVVPFILLALAARPLDHDREGSSFGKNAVASNSLGLIGFLVGTAGGWSNVAAGIGYYGSALSIWNRWFKHGQESVFPEHTRLTLTTTVRRSAPMKRSTGSTQDRH